MAFEWVSKSAVNAERVPSDLIVITLALIFLIYGFRVYVVKDMSTLT